MRSLSISRARIRREAEERCPTLARLSLTLSRLIEEAGIPGASAAVVHRGELWVGAAGYRQVGKDVAMMPETRFPTSCVNKLLIGILINQAAERGTLSLDDSIGRFFPDAMPPEIGKATISQLLSHSSGIETARMLDLSRNALRAEQVVHEFGRSTRIAPPGQVFSYGGNGYVILVAILEKIYQVSIFDLIRTKIFAALEIPQAILPEGQIDDQTAIGHFIAKEQGRLPVAYINTNPFSPVYETVLGYRGIRADHLALLGASLLGERGGAPSILSSGGLASLRQWVIATSPRATPTGWAQGIGIWGPGIFGIRGSYYGYRIELRIVPEVDLSVAVMVNRYEETTVFRTLIGQILNNFQPKMSPTQSGSAIFMPNASYCGVYTGSGRIAEVIERGHDLIMKVDIECDHQPLTEEIRRSMGDSLSADWYQKTITFHLDRTNESHRFKTTPMSRRVQFINFDSNQRPHHFATQEGFRLFTRLH